jgi:hypothetical protein
VELERARAGIIERHVVEDPVFLEVGAKDRQGAGIAPEQDPFGAGQQGDEGDRLALETRDERLLSLVDPQPLDIVCGQVV